MTAEFRLDKPVETRDGVEPTMVVMTWRRTDAALTFGFEVHGAVAHLNQPNPPRAEINGRTVQLDLSRYVAAFNDLATSLYLGPFRNVVNSGSNTNYYDLQIGQSFIETWDAYKTGNNRAQNRQAVSVERELAAIFGFDRVEINASPGNTTLQVIADDQPYQLQEHGAGLAQFFHVLAFVALRRPPFVFIDEPEQNLHPALQLDFLTTLAKYTTRGVAFSTHSIGLARAIGHEVYSVRRLPDDSREVGLLEGTRDVVEFLGELSFSGYQELGFRSILLVEGTTEVPTIQRWLRLYGIEREIVLLPLGGSSLINAKSAGALSEITRITTRVAVVIDSERDSESTDLSEPRAGFVSACEALGFNVHVLHRRALENYLTDDAIKVVKGERYSALAPYQSLSEATLPWAKRDNWRIAAEMKREDLDSTDIGQFFAGLAGLATDVTS